MATAAETLNPPATTEAPTQGLPEAKQTGWWDSVKDAEVKGWLANKNYPDAESALKSHWGLERLYGADKAGRTALLPKDENDAEGWKALSQKLGVPANATDYKLPLPEGTDDGFAKTAASWFHEAGVPPKMANAVSQKWNEWVAGQVKAGEEADKAEEAKQMQGLEQEWGSAFTEKRELAQRGFREFAKQFGLDDKATMERATSVLGAANLTKLFAGLGSINSESKFAGTDGGGSFNVSARDAQERVNKITADRTAGLISNREWEKTYLPEMERLGAILGATQ